MTKLPQLLQPLTRLPVLESVDITENPGATSLDAKVCVGCQKVLCVLLHGTV